MELIDKVLDVYKANGKLIGEWGGEHNMVEQALWEANVALSKAVTYCIIEDRQTQNLSEIKNNSNHNAKLTVSQLAERWISENKPLPQKKGDFLVFAEWVEKQQANSQEL